MKNLSKKTVSEVMSKAGKASWKATKHLKDADYFRRMQAAGVKKRLENKVKTGKY